MLYLVMVLFFCGAVAPGVVLPSTAQSTAALKITLKNGTSLEEKGRQQLVRLLDMYDLEPWTFTKAIVIESYVIPHSHPVLTLNTRNLDDDMAQLATFLHEQTHWFLTADERRDAVEHAIHALTEMYPDPPPHEEVGTRSEESTYLHLIVNWLELDALSHLVGETRARETLSAKGYYEWVYERVLAETDAIGSVLLTNGLAIVSDE